MPASVASSRASAWSSRPAVKAGNHERSRPTSWATYWYGAEPVDDERLFHGQQAVPDDDVLREKR
jgi:hypothetical protein